MLNHVLVPLDESELSEKAVPYAEQIVAQGGNLTFLAVIDVPAYPYMLTPGPYPVPVESSVDEYEKLLKNMSEHAREYLHTIAEKAQKSGFQTHLRVTAGKPADCILAAAEELKVDAIVMSTHGRSGLSRWMFGSVTLKVLSSAHCPVFVIPPKREKE